LLLVGRQVDAEHQVEELDRVVEGEQPAVVVVGRRVLDPAQHEGLDGAVGDAALVADRLRRVEALELQVVHPVVEVEGRHVALGAAALSEALAFLLRRRVRNEAAKPVQLRRRRKVEHVLHPGHHGDLTGPVRKVHALLGRRHLVAVEVGRALLELGEVLHGPQRPLVLAVETTPRIANQPRVDMSAPLPT